MEHIQPGLLHWTAYRDTIGADVHSYFHEPSGTLIDPMVPPERVSALGEPQRVVLTNRHHYRESDRFGCPVLCHEAGLHEFRDGRQVHGFAFGDELAPGVVALEVGVLTPEETALHVGDALAFADCVIRRGNGELGFVSDFLLGDDPQAVKDGLRAAFQRLCADVEFEALLLAHGEPMASGGRAALEMFATGRPSSID
jgi:glyoxylase-like metal-dependent hydrolase (beta-lactamase superfamily II)